MLFNSTAFLIFGPTVLLAHWLLRGRSRNVLLLAASYVFYGAWDIRFLGLIWLSTIVDYLVGRKIGELGPDDGRRKQLVSLSIATNLGVLGLFKYAGFFVAEATSLLESVGLGTNTRVLSIVLPVGISFYTFQTLAYTIDVYRSRIKPETRLLEFALFVAYFPQLVAGPIERAQDLLPQIGNTDREIDRERLWGGLQLIAIGFFKKVAIGDVLGTYTDLWLDPSSSPSTLTTVLGTYAFAFQIYADFSGYSDIARGVSRLLGIELIHNFQQPYLSRSITEFWRRWHISLSNWLRDYLYIPLGGNRRGRNRTYINLMLTMLLGGLWHGAGWTFVIWGALNGAYLAVERAFTKPLDENVPFARSHSWSAFRTLHLTCLAWVFFRAEDLGHALEILKGLGTWNTEVSLDGVAFLLYAVLSLAFIDIAQRRAGRHSFLTDRRPAVAAVLMAVMVTLTLLATGAPPRQFIYFQF